MPDYRTLVPTNQVPALETNGRILNEGANIALYLLNNQSHPITQNPDFNQWLMFNYATLRPDYSKLFSMNSLMAESAEKYALMQQLGNRTAELWGILDNHLQGRSFMVGDEPSRVDYLLAIYLRWGVNFPDTQIPVGSRVKELVENIVQLPYVKKAFADEGIDYVIPPNASFRKT